MTYQDLIAALTQTRQGYGQDGAGYIDPTMFSDYEAVGDPNVAKLPDGTWVTVQPGGSIAHVTGHGDRNYSATPYSSTGEQGQDYSWQDASRWVQFRDSGFLQAAAMMVGAHYLAGGSFAASGGPGAIVGDAGAISFGGNGVAGAGGASSFSQSYTAPESVAGYDSGVTQYDPISGEALDMYQNNGMTRINTGGTQTGGFDPVTGEPLWDGNPIGGTPPVDDGGSSMEWGGPPEAVGSPGRGGDGGWPGAYEDMVPSDSGGNPPTSLRSFLERLLTTRGRGGLDSLIGAGVGAWSLDKLLNHYKGAVPNKDFYDNTLRQSYENPMSYLQGPEYQSMQNVVHNKLQRSDAARGRLANDAGRQKLMMDHAASNMDRYRQTLGTNLGNQIQGYTGSGSTLNSAITSLGQTANNLADIIRPTR
jgi:hypothetical protein